MKPSHPPSSVLVEPTRPGSIVEASPQQRSILAQQLYQEQKWESAYHTCRGLLGEPDQRLQALYLLSLICHRVGRAEEGLAYCTALVQGKTNWALGWHTHGLLLQSLHRLEEALLSFREALRHDPKNLASCISQGEILIELRRYEEARIWLEKALHLQPQHIVSYTNLAALCFSSGDWTAAHQYYTEAFRLDPKDAETHYGLALLYLLKGDYLLGWREYEWRVGVPSANALPRNYPEIRWDGKTSLAGKTIFLHCEQGLGDTIQFARYVSLVKGYAPKRIILEVQPLLVQLMQGLKDADEIVAHRAPLPRFDTWCPLMSLPFLLGITEDTVPTPIPYLRIDNKKIWEWKERLSHLPRPLIGIAWACRPEETHHHDVRGVPLALVIEHLRLPMIVLHKYIRLEDKLLLAEHPHIYQCDSLLQDFTDTAAMMSEMDIVVTIDIAVAHLAGAMGKPVWIMLAFYSEWRWLLDRTDSPWYPRARLFRQTQLEDWVSVLREVKTELSLSLGVTEQAGGQDKIV